MKAMIVKEFRELIRDRRTLAMLVVLPLLLLIIFGYAANFYVSSSRPPWSGRRPNWWPSSCPRSST
jgi:ABC-2 type transport system permease protein